MSKRTFRSSRFKAPCPRSGELETTLDAAMQVRSHAISLFDRREGHAADWPLIAETLLRAAFAALDEGSVDQRSVSVLRRVHAGAYDRIVGNRPDGAP